MAQLDLWLDHYDDIYSDFDSRHYGKRRISEDFLYELKTAFAYKEGHIDKLLLQLPADKRDELQEKLIIENLSGFFKNQAAMRKEQYRQKRNAGLLLMTAGITIMIANTFISHYSNYSFLSQSLRVLFEPAGWFLLWTAMDTLFYGLKRLRQELVFFSDVSEVKWYFKSL
jgi:hypothetical protein